MTMPPLPLELFASLPPAVQEATDTRHFGDTSRHPRESDLRHIASDFLASGNRVGTHPSAHSGQTDVVSRLLFEDALERRADHRPEGRLHDGLADFFFDLLLALVGVDAVFFHSS